MRGKIIKGIGGFYYVHAEDGGLYECRAKGIFRKNGEKPLVGDNVEISVIDAGERTGNVDLLLPRKNALVRPAAANVDQALVVFAAAAPRPNLNLLDRFLISMRMQEVPVVICFNKTDLTTREEQDRLAGIYRDCGSEVRFLCVARSEGVGEVQELLEGRTTIVAGPSGVGKSSLTNALQSSVQMEVGEISRKIDRGKHTTRHTELIVLRRDTYFLDTPGFSSLYLPAMEPQELRDCYCEFAPYFAGCRFQGCMHLSEPDCAVKKALEEGRISRPRYENYVLLQKELSGRKRY